MPTNIEWCDETINPQGWGCWGPGGTPDNPRPCSYCYARRLAKRHIRPCELCRQFVPHWHEEQIEKALNWDKPRKIFWQSMGDLFHPLTPWEQIKTVLAAADLMPRHTHIFLTKNPARYQEFNPWPKNCWLGTTVTNQLDADERLPELMQVGRAGVLFVSHEPLVQRIDVRDYLNPPLSWRGQNLSWAIIGAMTGPGAIKPEPYWVRELIDQYRGAGVPIFLKDNLKWTEKIQEFPK
jgi:protein gp37